MPRVYAPRRPHVGYREDAPTLAALDEIAARENVDRTEIIRRATSEYVERTQQPASKS